MAQGAVPCRCEASATPYAAAAGRCGVMPEGLGETILRGVHDAVVVCDPDGRIQWVNESACRLFGYRRAQLRGRCVEVLLPPATAASHGRLVREFVRSSVRSRAMADRATVVGRRRDGSEIPLAASIAKVDVAHGVVLVAVLTDLTARHAAEVALAHRATHDSLTGLLNREGILAVLADRLDAASAPVTVLLLDLDRFKPVNDGYGHDVGDAVLRAVSRRLAAALGPGDEVGRLGGDEFLVVCAPSPERADERCAHLLRAVGEPVSLDGRVHRVTASIGTASSAVTGPSVRALLRAADVAMYEAKRTGHAHRAFDGAMRDELSEGEALEADLRAAVRAGELAVHYQAQHDLRDGVVVGVEALARWDHPRRGPVPPEVFIPMAERSGLIDELGLAVFTETCRQLRRWEHGPRPFVPATVSVNLSPRQLSFPRLVERVRRCLDEHAVDPRRLAVELTESALIDDPASARRVLRELRGLGIRVAIDDFGTGYASLAYLSRFPIDIVKIDRSFVARLVRNPRDRAIVRHVVSLADELGMSVVAEGVEHAVQVAVLLELGCRTGQGFHFGPARPGHAVGEAASAAVDGAAGSC
jgi:diguanylate cyclase (GGDEF)-like protein/PAS domain S-box-containing protein